MNENQQQAESQILEDAYNGFIAPAPPGTWIDEEEHRNRVNEILSKVSLKAGIGGGIPISPGEIINTNADVIVGRPGVIGPRVPYNSRVNEVPIGMQPPPLPPTAHTIATIPSAVPHTDSKLQGTDVQENYIGPPPPPHRQKIPEKAPTVMKDRPQMRRRSRPIPLRQFQRLPPNVDIHHDNLKYINDNHGHIYEIQKAPAVFSTDLPPIRVTNMHTNDGMMYQTEFPEVVDSHKDQLFVNIQPSQVASVVIPQGSTSALVFGGTIEPHTRTSWTFICPMITSP